MRNFKTEGIIIKRRNYKDSDRILTVLTKTHGKIYVRAAGVRKITSRRAGHIEPLNHCILSLYQGKAFPVLTEATTINNFSDIKKDLDMVGYAYHLCELIDGLCPENQENMRVFSLFQEALGRIGKSENIKEVIRAFEMQLLSTLGYLSEGRQNGSEANFAQMFDPDQIGVDTQDFIENILERRLKSRNIFTKLQ
jgi:DNA repair protein RecO (recombination protein O)